MDFMDFIYSCTNAECQKPPAAEATPEPTGERISVRCGLCGRKRTYHKEFLNRLSPALIEEQLRGHFTITRRYV